MVLCKDCKWHRKSSLMDSQFDRCGATGSINYVTGKIKLHRYCDWINNDGRCEAFEQKPPNRFLQFIKESWKHLGAK